MKKLLILSVILLASCSSAPDVPDVVETVATFADEVVSVSALPTATNTPIPTVTPTPTSTPWAFPTPIYDPEQSWPYGVPEMVEPIPEAWNENVKVYVLLGSDYSTWRTNLVTGTDNTDAFIILIVRNDPAMISMVSIPRDLYVFLPGFGMQRINTAWRIGGAEMVADTLRYNFGLPMHGYAYVRMAAFSRFIDDALHGIEIEVRNPVIDSCGNIEINLLTGTQFMDGPTATCYARIRMFDGAFKRQTRHIDVLLAMKEKFFEIAGDEPFTLLSKIFDVYMSEHRYTNVGILEVMETFPIAIEANDNDRVLEYQLDYETGIIHFDHPVTGAWLLQPADADCTYNLFWMAVMGEPWDTLPPTCTLE